MRHHAITWQDGSFERSACILSFDSRAARAAYPLQCAQRVESIGYAESRQYKRAGYPRVLVLWDGANFRPIQSTR